MPNIPYTAASKYFGCFLLAISIKPQSQPQCIWETWRTGLMKVAHLSFSRVGLRPCPPPMNKRKRSEWWWSTWDHPGICLAAPKGAGAVVAGAAGMGHPMQWQHQADRVTFHDSCIGKWGHGRALLFAAHLLPLLSTNEVAVSLSSKPRLQPRPSGIFGWQKKNT